MKETTSSSTVISTLNEVEEKLGEIDATEGNFYHLVKAKGFTHIDTQTLCGEPVRLSPKPGARCCPDCDRIAKRDYPNWPRYD